MISEKDTVYPRIKEEISNKELLDCFTPSESEIEFCRTETRSDNNFMCALLILKAFQRYGRTVLLEELPSKIILYVSEKTSIYISKENIAEYDSSRIRRHHSLIVKKYLDIKSYTDGGENIVSKIAYDLAKTREDIGDIINGTIEALVRERYELPAFSSLFRICRHERSVVYKEIYNEVFCSLNEEDKNRIISLLKYSSENTRSDWHKLKYEIPNPKVKSIQKLAEIVNELSLWDELTKKLDNVPMSKLKQFYIEAKSFDLSEIIDTEIKKRYTIVLAFIKMQKSTATDNLITIFIREMAKVRAKVEKKLQKYIEKNQDKTDKIIKRFSKANDICSDSKIVENEKIAPIKNILSSDKEIVSYAKSHTEFGGKRAIRFMAKIFSGKKHLFFKILWSLKIYSTNQDDTIVQAIDFMVANRYFRKKWIQTS